MKETLIMLGLCLLLTCGMVYFAVEASKATDERDDLATKLHASELRTQRLRADVLAATAKATKARASLKEALDAAPEYRDTAVPVPVRDSLCSTLRCVPTRAVSAPAG